MIEPIWKNETVMMLVYVGSRVALTVVGFTVLAAFALTIGWGILYAVGETIETVAKYQTEGGR